MIPKGRAEQDMDAIKCEFFIVRYVPNLLRGEFVNIGIILRQIVSPNESALVKFTTDWSRVLCLDPEADLSTIKALEEDFRDRIASDSGSASGVLDLLRGLSHGIDIDGPKGTMAKQEMETELLRLMNIYVDDARGHLLDE